jgi:hypothetical protein
VDDGEGSFEPCIPEADATPSTDFLHDEEDRYFDSSPYLLVRAAGTETNGFSGATGAALMAEIDDAGDIAIEATEEFASTDSDVNVVREIQQSHTPLSAGEGLALLEAACQLPQHSPPPVKQADASAAAETETNSFSGATNDALNAEMVGGDIAIAAVEDLASTDSDVNVVHEIQQSHTPLSAAEGLAVLEAACQLPQHSPPPVKQADDPTPAAARDPFEQARKSLSKSSFGIRVVHNDGDPSDRNLI